MVSELMEIYQSQSYCAYSSAHTDRHSDRDSYDGRPGGGHTEYDSHTDEDDDYDYDD